MKRYEPSIARVVFGIAAVAMTAITIGVAVIIPAKMDSAGRESPTLAASKLSTPASAGVVAGSASIDVVAVHEPELSTVPYIVQIEPQARGLSKTISHVHADRLCCAAAQMRAHCHSLEDS